jgi:hypothetical protein
MQGPAGGASKLTCPDCGAVIPAEDINIDNIDRALAKCRACNTVVDVDQALRGRGGARASGKRPRVPQPPAIKFEPLTYNVCAVLKGGQRVTLLSSLPEIDQALFVEQAVEEYLGIEDRPVGGELPRN